MQSPSDLYNAQQFITSLSVANTVNASTQNVILSTLKVASSNAYFNTNSTRGLGSNDTFINAMWSTLSNVPM